jgi:hypothetical protein
VPLAAERLGTPSTRSHWLGVQLGDTGVRLITPSLDVHGPERAQPPSSAAPRLDLTRRWSTVREHGALAFATGGAQALPEQRSRRTGCNELDGGGPSHAQQEDPSHETHTWGRIWPNAFGT